MGEEVSKPGLNPWTIPNLISLLRLAAMPLFLWLLFSRHNRVGAAWLLALLGATDWVDGYIARRFNQISLLGKVLDPLADRLLLGIGIISMMIDHSVPLWFAWSVIAREVLVSIAAIVLGVLGARRIDVTWVGKCGAFGLMTAFPFFLLGHAHISTHHVWTVVAWCTGIPGLALAWWALAQYVPAGRKALAEGRLERHTHAVS